GAVAAVRGAAGSRQPPLRGKTGRRGTTLPPGANPQNLSGNELELPATATPMIRQISTVLSVAPTAKLADTNVYRNDHVPTGRTGGLSVRACGAPLLTALDRPVVAGRCLDEGPSPVT